jgi:hypothetical protein
VKYHDEPSPGAKSMPAGTPLTLLENSRITPGMFQPWPTGLAESLTTLTKPLTVAGAAMSGLVMVSEYGYRPVARPDVSTCSARWTVALACPRFCQHSRIAGTA